MPFENMEDWDGEAQGTKKIEGSELPNDPMVRKEVSDLPEDPMEDKESNELPEEPLAGKADDMPEDQLAGQDEDDLPEDPLADKKTGDLPEDSKNSFDRTDIPIDPDIRNCPLGNGCWDGERGNSKWNPDPDFVPQKANSAKESWKTILQKYDIDGIVYKDGEPIFDDISKGTVKIEGFSSSRDDNFDKADIALAKQRGCTPEAVRQWRIENKYTWHECKDMETMQKVPSEIHNNVSHRGGVSNVKAIERDEQ